MWYLKDINTQYLVYMAQVWAKAFYHSPAWKRTRAAYMRIAVDTPFGIVPMGMCERCYEEGKIVPAKVVHHREHLTPENISNPNVTLSFSNLQRLCQDCHAVAHRRSKPQRVAFDEFGNVVRG